MTEFKLNSKEEDNLLEVISALKVVYGDYSDLKATYIFTPTGIGNNIKVVLKGYKREVKIFEVEKDITDYESW